MTKINASWLARDSIEYIWRSAGLPPEDLEYLHLENTGALPYMPHGSRAILRASGASFAGYR